tara:strand:- start:437 stop:1429 length:993 start_codon:yes stop_codon:yes gene_type:complete
MILKTFELEKINPTKKFFLFYGNNQGYKNEIIQKKFRKNYSENIHNYDESEILNNIENFYNNILTKSFFENEKLIIINRATDKIKILIEEILEKKIEDLVIILNANNLEKKSKLRSFFEKSRIGICVAFYEDNNQTLQTIISSFFRNCKISISQQAMNLIVQRCRGDRQNLNTELQKIECFIKNKNKIDINDLLKLTNLAENYDVSELVDSCLSKNKRKTINILNENNYSLDDCVFIIRTFLIKTKRLLKLCEELKIKKNIDAVIMSCKPPIFWKDKEVVKQQIQNWSYNNIKNLVFKINEIELLIKKNSNSSINLLSDFIIEQTTIISN